MPLIDTYPYSDYSESSYLSSTKPESSSTLSLSLYYGERDESRRQHYRCETIWKMLYYNTLYICSNKWVRKRLANRQSDTTESVVRVCLPPFTHTHTHSPTHVHPYQRKSLAHSPLCWSCTNRRRKRWSRSWWWDVLREAEAYKVSY